MAFKFHPWFDKFEQFWFHSVNNVMQMLSYHRLRSLWYIWFLNKQLVLFFLFGLGCFFFLIFLQLFFAYFPSPLPFLTIPSATHMIDIARVWHVIKMLRGNVTWAHKPEHLLMKAGASINTLKQLGSLSKVLISHTAEQPFCVGAQRVFAVPPGSTPFPELAFSFIHTALMNTSKLRTGQIWTQDRLR